MKPTSRILTKRLLGAAILSAALITPAVASAQDYAYAGQDQQIQGTVASINDTWNISVNDANGYTDSVELHQGTIINPTGLTLEPGMNVTIDGVADGPNFDATEIDTPYQYNGPAPTAVYYGTGSWYPGYAAGWGPSFSLVFNVGSRSWQQRPFSYGGQVRRAEAPPAGWQNQPHGFVGNAGGTRPRVAYAQPQPQRQVTQPQQRVIAPPAQPQRQFTQPQQRTYAAPAQPQRTLAAPAAQPQRQFAAPAPQARTFAAPTGQAHGFAPAQAQRSAAPVARSNGGDRGGDHRR